MGPLVASATGAARQTHAGGQGSSFIAPGVSTKSLILVANLRLSRNGSNRGKAVSCARGEAQIPARGLKQNESGRLQPELWRFRTCQGLRASTPAIVSAPSVRAPGINRCSIVGIPSILPSGRWQPIRLITEGVGGKTTEARKRIRSQLSGMRNRSPAGGLRAIERVSPGVKLQIL
jgi:hypothetical protein